MKKLLIILFILPFFAVAQEESASKLVGTWTSADSNEVGTINFYEDGYASFEVDGQVFGGKEFTIKGEQGSMTYEINTTTDPIQVDFIVTKLSSGKQKKLLCIAQFINSNTIKFNLNFEDMRPEKFDESNTIVLNRSL